MRINDPVKSAQGAQGTLEIQVGGEVPALLLGFATPVISATHVSRTCDRENVYSIGFVIRVTPVTPNLRWQCLGGLILDHPAASSIEQLVLNYLDLDLVL